MRAEVLVHKAHALIVHVLEITVRHVELAFRSADERGRLPRARSGFDRRAPLRTKVAKAGERRKWDRLALRVERARRRALALPQGRVPPLPLY